VFDYDYVTLAAVLDKSEANCRQLVSRARRQLRAYDLSEHPSPREQLDTATAFMDALQRGDVQDVLATLADDVVWWSDGGGKAFAARKPIRGAEMVAHFALNLTKRAPDDLVIRWMFINQRPGLLLYVAGQPLAAYSIAVSGSRVQRVYAVLNPDKLIVLPALDK
jgi:RNA polymerase sigma-70 factor, ECF subfamily